MDAVRTMAFPRRALKLGSVWTGAGGISGLRFRSSAVASGSPPLAAGS